ncbi:MAG TPA: metal ABC transporter permease [Candidatus Tectomicrobia bacterium]|nr:metal ABC transporter permease [Candidatus Tectomicrobia bacterium]
MTEWPLAPLLEPLTYAFFRRALLASCLVGALCGLVGVYIVLRRMSYIGHGLSHAVFGGAVISYLLQVNFYLGAGLWGMGSALLINEVAQRRKLGADAAIGIVTMASFAVGVAGISRQRRFTRNFEAALFGNVLAIAPADLWMIAGVAVASLVGILILYKPLLFSTFDEEVAEVYGIPTHSVNAVFALMLAAVIIVSMQTMGVTLIAASLVIPASAARLLTDRFGVLLWLSSLLGAGVSVVGMYASYYLDLASGATIVLIGTGFFLAAWLLSAGKQGA